MITVVPAVRIAPTDGNMPLRTFQKRGALGGIGREAHRLGTSAFRRAPPRSRRPGSRERRRRRRRASRPAAPRRRGPSARDAPPAGPACPRPSAARRGRRARPPRPASLLSARHRAARGLEVVEQDQRARLVGVLRDRAVGDLADEAERALRADHQVREDVDRIVEVDQRVEAVAGRVLHPELVPDARGQRGVVARARARAARARARAPAVRAANAARLAASRGVEHRAVGEHDAHAGQRVVAVLRRAAAHAARVVGGDAADHRGVDRRRVGADLAAEAARAADWPRRR